MKIILPSLGVYGCRSVEMRPATFDDLRAVHSMNNECEALLKYQFVQRLTNADFSKITKYDADYLFAVAALSISFNEVDFSVECPKCHKESSYKFVFSDKEIDTLPKVTLPVVRTVCGDTYAYRILTAQQDMDAIEYALSQDEYEVAYQDAVVCFTLGRNLDEIDFVHSLPAGVYLSVFVFQQCMFHGFNNLEQVECTHCHNDINTRIQIPASLISLDLSTLMQQYTKVSDQMSFDSFLDFTIPEFKTLIESLNSQV